MKRVGALVCGMFWAFGGWAQQMQGPPQTPGNMEDQQFFFFETINLVANDSLKSRVDIPYRIDNQFFVAVKNSDPAIPYPFQKRGEVLVELLDEHGVSKAREINRFEIGVSEAESKPDERSWYEATASFTVPPGEYTVVFEIDDIESERKFLDRDRKVTAKAFAGTTLSASSPVFVLQPAVGEHLSLLNYGGNILFGKEASLFLQVYSSNLSPEPFRIEYSITTQTFLYQDPTVAFADTIEELKPLSNSWPNLSSESSSPTYTLTVGDKTGTSALLIPLKSEKLPLRPFRLDVKLKQGSSETTLQHPFRVVWPEMPMSLRDIDFALEALRYITREEELDSLKSGPRDTRLKHLEEFWKSKDRTPDTEYNEMMVEYYRRVDHTMRAFSSMRGGDGYKTDRGRIYILYGPPTKTDRSLDPAAGYQEVWVYEKQSKKFVFLDQSKSGNYTLVATQNL